MLYILGKYDVRSIQSFLICFLSYSSAKDSSSVVNLVKPSIWVRMFIRLTTQYSKTLHSGFPF